GPPRRVVGAGAARGVPGLGRLVLHHRADVHHRRRRACRRPRPRGLPPGVRGVTAMTNEYPTSGFWDLTGKKAMVIGADNPAGGAIARAYAEAGADVALCALTPDEAVMRARAVRRDIEKMGRRAPEYIMDVTLGKNVQVTTRQIVKELGGLDIVAIAPDQFL